MNKLSLRQLLLVSSLPVLSCLTTVASAQELRDAAAAKGVLFGSVLYNLEVPANKNLLINNSSVGTVPAYWKYTTHIVEGPLTFAETDRAIELAESNSMEVHGHPLVWGADYHIPDWVLEKPLQDAEAIMLDHIRQLAGRYRGRVDTWDVVNEAIEYDGTYRDSYWHRAMTEEFIFKAFSEAHAIAPDATLLYNDYQMESNESKFRTIKNLLSWLQSSNVRVDGLGWQLHVWADDVFKPEFKLEEYMAEISEMGLDNYVTELDVRIPNNSEPELIKQKQAYKKITEIFLRNATRGKYFQTWGLSDKHTWLDINNNEYDSSNIIDHPLPFDRNYTKKPAYWGLHEAFTNSDSPDLHHSDLQY